MRKDGSLFSTVVDFINAIPVGSTYKSSELVNATRGVEDVTWWKRTNSNEAYRTRTYQTYLRRLGYLQNVKRGEWMVLGHAPEWLDLGVVNFALGYVWFDSHYKGKTQSEWLDVIEGSIRIAQLKQDLVEEAEAVNKKAPQPNEAIITFEQCMDAMKACVELRQIGVLAVPLSAHSFEIHVINKSAAEDLANWLIKNGYDDITELPELEDLVGAYYPEPEPEVEDEPCECKKVYLTVLNYADRNVDVYRVPEDEIYEFLEETYGAGYDDFTEYMTSEELKLNVDC